MLNHFKRIENQLFNKQLKKRLRFKNIFKSVIVGTIIFFVQYFMQTLLLSDGWSIKKAELIVEAILSALIGIFSFFIWDYLSKSKFKKIKLKLESEDFEIANFAQLIEQEHNYNGTLFLKKDSLNFKGNFYSKEKTILIETQHIVDVAIQKVFRIDSGFKIKERNSRIWYFKTEDPDIWIEAITEKIS